MQYELTLILAGNATSAQKKSTVEKVEKTINTFKGKVLDSDDWGKLELAYPIRKSDSGVYHLFNLELEGKDAKGLSTKLTAEEDIIRYLLIRKDK